MHHDQSDMRIVGEFNDGRMCGFAMCNNMRRCALPVLIHAAPEAARTLTWSLIVIRARCKDPRLPKLDLNTCAKLFFNKHPAFLPLCV
jgi:hypothetical protein